MAYIIIIIIIIAAVKQTKQILLINPIMTASEICLCRWQLSWYYFLDHFFLVLLRFMVPFRMFWAQFWSCFDVKILLLSWNQVHPRNYTSTFTFLVRTWTIYLFLGDYIFHQPKRSCITTLLNKSCF